LSNFIDKLRHTPLHNTTSFAILLSDLLHTVADRRGEESLPDAEFSRLKASFDSQNKKQDVLNKPLSVLHHNGNQISGESYERRLQMVGSNVSGSSNFLNYPLYAGANVN